MTIYHATVTVEKRDNFRKLLDRKTADIICKYSTVKELNEDPICIKRVLQGSKIKSEGYVITEVKIISPIPLPGLRFYNGKRAEGK